MPVLFFVAGSACPVFCFVLVVLFFCGLAAATIWGDSFAGNSSTSDKIVLVAFFLFIALICFVLASSVFDEYRKGYAVMKVQGEITLNYYQESDGYWLRIYATGIPVSSNTYRLFEAGHYYNLYFIAPFFSERILIAAEKLKQIDR